MHCHPHYPPTPKLNTPQKHMLFTSSTKISIWLLGRIGKLLFLLRPVGVIMSAEKLRVPAIWSPPPESNLISSSHLSAIICRHQAEHLRVHRVRWTRPPLSWSSLYLTGPKERKEGEGKKWTMWVLWTWEPSENMGALRGAISHLPTLQWGNRLRDRRWLTWDLHSNWTPDLLTPRPVSALSTNYFFCLNN